LSNFRINHWLGTCRKTCGEEGERGGVDGELTLNKTIMRIMRIGRVIEAIRQLIVFVEERGEE
jgi:hypothetical protein